MVQRAHWRRVLSLGDRCFAVSKQASSLLQVYDVILLARKGSCSRLYSRFFSRKRRRWRQRIVYRLLLSVS